MIIELIGTPGTGKSFWFNYILDTLKKENKIVLTKSDIDKLKVIKYTKFKKIITYLIFFFNFNTIYLLVHIIILKKTTLTMKKNIFLWYLDFKLDYKLIQEMDFDFMVLDEGIIQRIISCFISENTLFKKTTINLLNDISKMEYKIVYFKVDSEVSLKRIENRKDIDRFIGKSTKERIKILINFNKSFENFFKNFQLNINIFHNTKNIEIKNNLELQSKSLKRIIEQ